MESYAQQEAILEPTDVALIVDAPEHAVVLVLVVEPLKDRMHQVAVDAEDAEFHRGAGRDPHRRLVGKTQRVDVALPVVSDVDGSRRRRRRKRDILGHAAWN